MDPLQKRWLKLKGWKLNNANHWWCLEHGISYEDEFPNPYTAEEAERMLLEMINSKAKIHIIDGETEISIAGLSRNFFIADNEAYRRAICEAWCEWREARRKS